MGPRRIRDASEDASVDDVRAAVMKCVAPLQPRRVLVSDARGLILSSPVIAPHDVPPFANSAMDGYALQARDLVVDGTRLQVVDETMAGDEATSLGPGEAIRIMTGAPIPFGADAVVRLEDTVDADDATVLIQQAVASGTNVRIAGEDIPAGAVALKAGTPLGAAHLALLASAGVLEVEAFPRPRVGVLSTGDELAIDANPLQPGRIRDANRPALLALVADAGCDAVDLGVVGDAEDEITSAITSGIARVDALVTSGGVSAGDLDLVAAALEQLEGAVRSFDVAMRPGRPFSFAQIDGCPIFALPGNPAAAMIGFELFARPALRTMAGFRDVDRPRLAAIADKALPRRCDGKTHFVRVTVTVSSDGQLHVSSAGPQNPHVLSTSAASAGLVVLPDGDGAKVGDRVELMVLDWNLVRHS